MIIVYSKTDEPKFNVQYELYTEGTLRRWKGIKRKTTIAEDGSLIQTEDSTGIKGANMGDVWQISVINPAAIERIGYPTQKPEELLECIIKSSSNEGDVVADFFGGGGTTFAVAMKHKRRFIGCDSSRVAIAVTLDRLVKIGEEMSGVESNISPKESHFQPKL